jgi:hypothetical protein
MRQLIPPPELYGQIKNQIEHELVLLQLKRRMLLYGLSFAMSLAIFIMAFKNFFVQADQTGFLQLLKLLSTDFSLLSAHLSDYLLSLAESLPAVSMALTGVLFLLILLCGLKLFASLFKIKRLNAR